jgi:hypothetical protein
MAPFLAAGMQPATWLSAGMGEAIFSSRLARTRATKHEAAQEETEAVAGTAVAAGAEEPAPVPVGVTGHQTQRTRGQVGPPGPHPTQPSSSLGPGAAQGANGGQ